MELELYHLWKCPYSAKVRSHIEERNLDRKIAYYEIGEDPHALERLQEMTGGTQVPCLVIDGEPLLESGAIIRWLEANLKSDRSAELGR